MKKIILLACVAAIACGDDDVPTADSGPGMTDGGADVVVLTDAGPGPDSGTPDSGTPDSGTPDSGTPDSGTPDSGPPAANICDPSALENVTASADMVVSTTIDTSTAAAEPEALESCGDELTGQIIVAITIPGVEANQIVQVSTLNEGTEDIDTILDFRTECGTEGVCFDDVDGTLFSRGTIIADGGSTVFALISGYGEADQGTIEVTTEILGTAGGVGDDCDEVVVCGNDLLCNAEGVCEMAEPPVLTEAAIVRYDDVGDDMETLLAMGMTGSDPNGDVVSFNFTFLDADGADFDFIGEGNPTFTFGFEEVADLATFMEATFIGAGATAMFPAEAVGFRISLNDSTGLESEEITGDITTGVYSGDGESCGFTSQCDPDEDFVCGATDECETPAAPVLTATTVVRYDNIPDGEDMSTLLGMGLSGDDANGDVVAFNFTFVDADGDDFDFLGEGDPTFVFGLDEAAGLVTFMEAAFINGGPTGMFPAEAVAFRISLVDSTELESNEMTGDIDAGTFAADGESCAFTALCDPAAMLICGDADMCEAAPAP